MKLNWRQVVSVSTAVSARKQGGNLFADHQRYVKYGASLLFDPVQRQAILGIAEIAESVATDTWQSIIQS